MQFLDDDTLGGDVEIVHQDLAHLKNKFKAISLELNTSKSDFFRWYCRSNYRFNKISLMTFFVVLLSPPAFQLNLNHKGQHATTAKDRTVCHLPWMMVRAFVRHATCVDTIALSHLSSTSVYAGSTAASAETLTVQILKYSNYTSEL